MPRRGLAFDGVMRRSSAVAATVQLRPWVCGKWLAKRLLRNGFPLGVPVAEGYRSGARFLLLRLHQSTLPREGEAIHGHTRILLNWTWSVICRSPQCS